MHPLVAAVILGPPVFGICEDIVDVDNTTLQDSSPRCRASVLTDWISLYDFFDEFSGVAIAGGSTIDIAVLPIDQASVGVAQTNCLLQKALQHWLEIECRATDDLEDLGSSSLLLERLLELAAKPCDLGFLINSR